MRAAALVLFLLVPARGARAGVVQGVVFSDTDGDGARAAGEQGVPGVAVFWETALYAVTGADGRYQLSAPEGGIMWARIPEGFVPTPTWGLVPTTDVPVALDLPLRPSAATGPLTFVQASDTHLGVITKEQVRAALEQAIDVVPAPHFLVVTGDLTNLTYPTEFMQLAEVVSGLPIPFVPVVGNHDWYDGGPEYRAQFGPPQYSFDDGGVHFVALNFMASEAEQLSFLAKDLALLTEDRPVVAFTHSPPTATLADALSSAGVDYIFSGHLHANHVFLDRGMLQVNTETAGMGGLDYTPAGFRVVSLVGGTLALQHHTLVAEQVATLIHPRPDACVNEGPFDLIAAVETGGTPPEVTVAIDGAQPIALGAAGGWTYVAPAPALAPGQHDFRLRVANRGVEREGRFCVAPAIEAHPAADWPQLQGSAEHLGATTVAIAPPLRSVWARPTGGHLLGGSPVFAGGRLFVPVADLNDATRGGVVALDGKTGSLLWEDRTGPAVRNSPAVAGEVVVYVTNDLRVCARDVATGDEIWTVDLSFDPAWGITFTAPTIADDAVFVPVGGSVVALELASGEVRWTRSMTPAPKGYQFSSVAVTDGIGVSPIARVNSGAVAWTTASGDELWRVSPPLSNGVFPPPLVSGGRAYLFNIASQICAVDLYSGTILWANTITGGGEELGLGLLGAAALAGDNLIVPSPQESVFARSTMAGEARWEIGSDVGAIAPFSYQTFTSGYLAPVVVTGRIVWAGGVDGKLRAVDAERGSLLWIADLGAPILSGPVPTGDTLFVGTWDGTVRALVVDPAARGDGCGCLVAPARRESGWGAAVIAVLLFAALRRRRRAPTGP